VNTPHAPLLPIAAPFTKTQPVTVGIYHSFTNQPVQSGAYVRWNDPNVLTFAVYRTLGMTASNRVASPSFYRPGRSTRRALVA
jgi:hypothetical protein